MLIKNKRGVEQPQAIIYVLYTVILTIAGIYIAFNYLAGIDLNVEFEDHATRFSALTARLVGTSECLATETSFTAPSDERNIKYAQFGILDAGKLLSEIVPTKCISNEAQFWLNVSTVDGSLTKIMWSCPAGISTCGQPDTSRLGVETPLRPCSVPPPNQRNITACNSIRFANGLQACRWTEQATCVDVAQAGFIECSPKPCNIWPSRDYTVLVKDDAGVLKPAKLEVRLSG